MAAYDEARQILAAAYRDWRALAGMSDPNVFADEIFGSMLNRRLRKPLRRGWR
ncbi:MAG: hypothetical protein ACM3WV_03520 [Bacillota bacterium]